MSLHALPAGARVLVDANILIYARRSMSVQCRELLERCAQREISGVLTNDSLHLAAGLRVGLRLVATADPQFDAVPGITVFRPDDL